MIKEAGCCGGIADVMAADRGLSRLSMGAGLAMDRVVHLGRPIAAPGSSEPAYLSFTQVRKPLGASEAPSAASPTGPRTLVTTPQASPSPPQSIRPGWLDWSDLSREYGPDQGRNGPMEQTTPSSESHSRFKPGPSPGSERVYRDALLPLPGIVRSRLSNLSPRRSP